MRRKTPMPNLLPLKKALGSKAKPERSLAPYTSLKIGGPAALFFTAGSVEELTKAIKLSRSFFVPWFIFGQGSNLLISDQGFPGLVIHNQIFGIKVSGNRITVKSGELLEMLIKTATKYSLGGIEKMSGIPGTIGGAIYGNAGAYGQTISDHLKRVEVFDGKRIRWLSRQEGRFSYRESVFKKKDWVILEAEFQLYPSLKKDLKKTSREIIALRSAKYPINLKCPGSFFKNIKVEELSASSLKKIPKNVISFRKIPAGYLLEAVGAKGKRKEGIKVADYHGNLFFNSGGGKAADFLWLTKYFREKVKKKFGVWLEPEVKLIGFDKKF